MNSIFDLIANNHNYTEEDLKIYKNYIITKSFAKREILQKSRDQTPRIYFVKKGLLRSYIIDSDGKEHIFMFAPEGWIIHDSNEIQNSVITELFIDALEKSEVEIINTNILYQSIVSPQLKTRVIENLLRRLSVLQNRVLMMMSASAIERYEHFKATYPQILFRVPQKMIASYLGITPEALSKIKTQKLRTDKSGKKGTGK
ncbi:MAG: Crp/Fnr family transcriptional regulator [Bacteroidota bacterium]